MKNVSVYDLRTNLAEYLDMVSGGGRVVVRKFKKPIAMLVPYDEDKVDYRKFLGFRGKGGERGASVVRRLRMSKIERDRVVNLRHGRI